MNHEKNINNEQDNQVHPIIIWILASILIHLLLSLGFLSIKIKKAIDQEHMKFDQKKDQATLMLDPKKLKSTPTTAPNIIKSIPQSPQKQIPPIQQKIDEPKEPKAKPEDYFLIPGCKGLDEQQIDQTILTQQTPHPKDQKKNGSNKPLINPELTEKKSNIDQQKSTKQTITEQSQSADIIQKHHHSTKPLDEAKNHQQPESINSNPEITKQSIQKIKNQTKVPIEQQDPYQYVPTPSRTISFKDLNLGFNPHAHNVGNTASLVNYGSRFDTPDKESLKHITYKNQCANMLSSAFRTHPQVSLRSKPQGHRYYFKLIIDRKGKPLEIKVLQPSGDLILDKIILESIQSISLFPDVPSFIADNPYEMNWVFLH